MSADLRAWAQTNWRGLALVCGSWGAACWLLNVFLIVVYYDGWRKVPFGGASTGGENTLLGGLFWTLLSSLLFSLKTRRAGQHVGEGQTGPLTPAAAKGAREGDAELASGVAAGVVLFHFFGAAAPLYAAVLLTARLSSVSFRVTLLTFRGCLWLASKTAARLPNFYARLSGTTLNPLRLLRRFCGGMLLGCAVNFLIGLAVPSAANILMTLTVAFCVWRAVVGLVESRGGERAACLLMIAGALLAEVCLSSRVWADDGGWQESRQEVAGLFDNPGFAHSVSSGAAGGLAAGIGAAVGRAVDHLFGHAPLDIEEAMRKEMQQARSRRRAEESVERETHRPRFRLGEKRPTAYEGDAVGMTETSVRRGEPDFETLTSNENPDIVFKDEEATGADRLMTARLKERLDALADKVKAEWPGVKLRVTEAWDENDEHRGKQDNHYGGRAADITTSDKDSEKLGRLAQLAADAGMEWTFYENDLHVHVSVGTGGARVPSADPERYVVRESAPTPRAQPPAPGGRGRRSED